MEKSPRVIIDDLIVDLSNSTVHRGDDEVSLSQLSFKLFNLLIDRAPNVVSHQELIEIVWEGVLISEENLKQRISMLRKSLGVDTNKRHYIKNVRGIGYKVEHEIVLESLPELDAETHITGTSDAPEKNKPIIQIVEPDERKESVSKTPHYLLFVSALLVIALIAYIIFLNNQLTQKEHISPTSVVNQIDVDTKNNWSATPTAIVWAAKNAKKAFCLDGYDDYVEIASDETNNVSTEDFTIEAWVQSTSLDQRIIVDKRFEEIDNTVQGYVAYMDEGKLAFQLADGKGSWYCEEDDAACSIYESNYFIADGQWHFVAVSVDRDNQSGIKFYVDGKLVSQADPRKRQASLENDMPMRIGSRSSYTTGQFQGGIAYVALYHYALTSEEINFKFQRGMDRSCESVGTKGGI